MRPYDADVRAVVVDAEGQPAVREVPDPDEDGERVRVRACGLCGSDVEKLGPASAGRVLGHEVVGETNDGRRVVLVHHLPCGECDRCRAGHESTCESFRAATIVPGGFAERASARGGFVELSPAVDDALGTFAEPLACVLRGAERVPPGDVVIVGGGFIGQLFASVLRRRGDRVSIVDLDPARATGAVPKRVPAAVVTAAGAAGAAVERVEPGGVVLVFADPGRVELDRVYRDEITVVGSRSATPRHLAEAAGLLEKLELPKPLVLPLGRFAEGVELYRRRQVLKVVFTP